MYNRPLVDMRSRGDGAWSPRLRVCEYMEGLKHRRPRIGWQSRKAYRRLLLGPGDIDGRISCEPPRFARAHCVLGPIAIASASAINYRRVAIMASAQSVIAGRALCDLSAISKEGGDGIGYGLFVGGLHNGPLMR